MDFNNFYNNQISNRKKVNRIKIHCTAFDNSSKNFYTVKQTDLSKNVMTLISSVILSLETFKPYSWGRAVEAIIASKSVDCL